MISFGSMRTVFRENVRHWTQDLGIQGLFISGKQGEFYAMTLERTETKLSNWQSRPPALMPKRSCRAATRTWT